MGIYRLKPWKDWQLNRLALWLCSHRVHADQITFTGLISGVGAAVCVWRELIPAGLGLIFLSIFADLMDGAVARAGGFESVFGKFFDAICDRIVEASWVGALIVTQRIPWWGWLLPLGSVLLLVARTYAFRWGLETSFVNFARFERMTAMIAVAVLPWHRLTYPLYLAATLAMIISVSQIVAAIYRRSGSFRQANSVRCHS